MAICRTRSGKRFDEVDVEREIYKQVVGAFTATNKISSLAFSPLTTISNDCTFISHGNSRLRYGLAVIVPSIVGANNTNDYFDDKHQTV